MILNNSAPFFHRYGGQMWPRLGRGPSQRALARLRPGRCSRRWLGWMISGRLIVRLIMIARFIIGTPILLDSRWIAAVIALRWFPHRNIVRRCWRRALDRLKTRRPMQRETKRLFRRRWTALAVRFVGTVNS